MKKYLEARIELFVISLVLIVSIVAFCILNSSTAWFARNGQVQADGISISAEASSNLIIAKDPADITAGNINFDVSFENDKLDNMIPVTRDTTLNPSEPHLVYVTNHYAVDFYTGLVKNDADLGLTPVPTTDNEVYFIEKTVYLASVVGSIDVTALTATITVGNQGELSAEKYLEDKEYLKAATVDFYVGSVSTEGYRGTTSIAESLSGAIVDLFDSDGGEIPSYTDEPITVIMRFYFDGALVDGTSGDAYINSVKVNTAGINLGVQFSAVE